ncbi:MAG: amino acid ABC transporter permease [Planctomycetaceae bacterium]|nr:amino acid ABC transporter permease [Planctomycetaceae bacterium]
MPVSKQRTELAHYEEVGQDYLEKRKLRPSAGWVLLWALGVGAVISGDFAGWQTGLLLGGFWGLAAATLLMAVMYVCMVFTIAELSSALPHAGGFFSFTRNALGPLGGFLCGLTDTIEYVLTPAVIVYYIGGYLNALVYQDPNLAPAWLAPVWWVVAYGVFVAINIRGVELTLKIGLVVTALAIGVLVVFYVGALATGAFDAELLFTVEADPGHSQRGLPHGLFGVFASLPFAIWFYLAIEQLPLAAEESNNVVRDMPRALLLGIGTLLVLSLLTLVLNSGVGGGAATIGNSDAPLEEGFRAVFGLGATSRVLGLVALTGLIASFHTIIYAYGRVLFALSRAGYFPRWISITGRQQTPWVALILGAVVGLGCAAAIEWTQVQNTSTTGGEPSAITTGSVLLNMAVFGAVISYAMVMISYIVLRITRPELPRPYRSPLGVPGAVIGAMLSLLALAATFSVTQFRPGVWGVAVFLVIGLAWFLCYSRHHLVAQAPEEEVALLSEAHQELSRDQQPTPPTV